MKDNERQEIEKFGQLQENGIVQFHTIRKNFKLLGGSYSSILEQHERYY